MIFTDTPVRDQITIETNQRREKDKQRNEKAKNSLTKQMRDKSPSRKDRKRNKGKATKRKLISDDNQCVSCGISYGSLGDPRGKEAWFRCLDCCKWAHESCRNVIIHDQFLCYICMDSD